MTSVCTMPVRKARENDVSRTFKQQAHQTVRENTADPRVLSRETEERTDTAARHCQVYFHEVTFLTSRGALVTQITEQRSRTGLDVLETRVAQEAAVREAAAAAAAAVVA